MTNYKKILSILITDDVFKLENSEIIFNKDIESFFEVCNKQGFNLVLIRKNPNTIKSKIIKILKKWKTEIKKISF